jgi:SagB-type dehydrogenase family enzyme
MTSTSLNRQTAVGRTVLDLLSRPATSFPERWSVDWSDEPYRFKIYEGLRRIALDAEVPLADDAPVDDDPFVRLAHLLFCSAAPMQMRLEIEPRTGNGHASPTPEEPELSILAPSALNYFRAVASGGALFPWNLYVCAPGVGVTYYNPALHALDVLDAGDVPSLSLIVTVTIWRNFFKYGHSSLRLHGLDAGSLAGQILALAPRFGFDASVVHRFADAGVAALLGIDTGEEVPYAIIPLERRRPAVWPRGNPPRSSLERSRRVKPFPLLKSFYAFSADNNEPTAVRRRPVRSETGIALPPPAPSLMTASESDAIFRRRTGIDQTVAAQTSPALLSTLLDAVVAGYPSDLGDTGARIDHVSLFCAVRSIKGIEPGIYSVNGCHLDLRTRGDCSIELQESYYLGNLNMAAAAFVVFLAVDFEEAMRAYGNRGLRIAHFEAGIVTQRFYRAGVRLGTGIHPFLGFDGRRVARLLGVDYDTLIPILGIAVGEPPRNRACLTFPMWT